MFKWDSTRRDGRTNWRTNELITLKGKVLSKDSKNFVLRTDEKDILVGRGSYYNLPEGVRFFTICEVEGKFKLVDWL